MARVLIFIVILLSVGESKCGEILWPIKNYQHLTSGHADSRYDHFHGGVDIRTGGNHLEVVAPLDGRIERIAISPSGYGKVVYFRMDNDTTAVFGHLDRFAPRLESIVRDSQFVVGTYRVNLIYEQELPELRFKQGDVLAFTGQTGRGAPHLHFELRNEAVQTDPLAVYRNPDSKPPVISELRFVRFSEFDLQSSGEKIHLKKIGDGSYRGNDLQSDEPIAFLISCYDPGPWNRHAVPSEVRVIIGQDTVYSSSLTDIDLLGSKNIYAELVWKDIVRRDRDVRRLFNSPACRASRRDLSDGWITSTENETVLIEVIDRSGNKSVVSLDLRVNSAEVELPNTTTNALRVGQFEILGDDAACSWGRLQGNGSHEVKVGNSLDGYFDRLTLTYTLTPQDDRASLYWYKVSSKGKRALWTVPDEPDSIMSCYLQRGGVYGLTTDSTPPRLLISRSRGGFKFDLRDSETGIDDSMVRCSIDGKTAIAEYEYEENGGRIRTQNKLEPGEHFINFTAANRAGLVKEWTVSMTLP